MQLTYSYDQGLFLAPIERQRLKGASHRGASPAVSTFRILLTQGQWSSLTSTQAMRFGMPENKNVQDAWQS
eukprot:1161589-Pelagomonas_calceolata.AAC.8